MKKYSCKRCLKGRAAYRSPSSFRYRQHKKVSKLKRKNYEQERFQKNK